MILGKYLCAAKYNAMRNITVAISDTAYRQARVWAAQRDMSLSAVVQFLLEELPRTPASMLRGFPDPIPLPRNTTMSTKRPPQGGFPIEEIAASKQDSSEEQGANSGL
jgi:hypothetical protein